MNIMKLYIGMFAATVALGAYNGLQANLGFISPIDAAKAKMGMATSFEANGEDYGVTMSDAAIRPAGAPQGAIVTGITPGGPSDQIGLKVGDVVTVVKRNVVHNTPEAYTWLKKSDNSLTYLVWRNGQQMFLSEQRMKQQQTAAAAMPAPLPTVTPDTSWQIGVQIGDAGQRGPVVRVFEEGSLAEKAGMQVGDVLTAINGQGFIDTFGAADQLKNHRKGNLTVKILRDGQPMTLTIVRETPTPAPAQSAADKVYGQLK